MSSNKQILNFINGEARQPSGTQSELVVSPLDGSTLGELHFSSTDDLNSAVSSAQAAFESWSQLPVKERVQVFIRYRSLLEKNMSELAELVRLENGKTIGEAIAEVEKSIEITEFACSMPQLLIGQLLEVSKGVECRSETVPLGVVASICPFNFPMMVPHWTIPISLAVGNCMILKPSEKVPLSAVRTAELLTEAGLPKGVFNVIHGSKEVVGAICEHPSIQAVSFVGSTAVAKQVYRSATNALKRCLALGGAKNHLLVLPDANPAMSAQNIVASMSGCAGQRCMAASVMVAVGDVDNIIQAVCDEAKKLRPGHEIGAIITEQSKQRIEKEITAAEENGASILLDGRGAIVNGAEKGFYVGPTVIDHVRSDMPIAQNEIFGPVLSIVRVADLNEALALDNSSPYGNATSVFTQTGGIAADVIRRANSGMIGVNIGVPVPREPFSFGGWNQSKFGTGDITGVSSIAFWTQLKKSTIKWNPESRKNWMS